MVSLLDADFQSGTINDSGREISMRTTNVCTFIAWIAMYSVTSIADDSAPRLHPVEAACIEYELSGQMQQGTSTRCHRNYAYEQYEIQNITIGFGGFSQVQNMHNITIGNTIYAINLQTNTGTKTINPMYDAIVAALQDTNPADMADAFISAMGFSATGSSKAIAGKTCNVYTAGTMGTVCFTEDGLMLEQSVMGNSQTATSVSIGDGGDEANYTLYQTVPITDGPDLSNMPNLQNLMNQVPQQ